MHSFLSSSTKRTILLLGLLALCLQSAYAHTYLSSIVLNDGAPLSEGDCVRPHPLGGYDSPIPLLTSPDMTCGWLPSAAQAANRRCPIAAGQKIGLQWHHQSANPGDDIVDPSHVGPILVYLAKSDTGAGNVWFKIYEDGFTDGSWAVTKLIANGGRVDITLPTDIAPGNYLLRGEILALHGAYALNGVQPYVGCVELTISGSGSANPAGVAFPGYYTNTDPGMLFSVYQTFTTYIIPGPPVYKSGSAGSSSGSASSGSNTAAPTTKPTSAPSTAPTTKPTSGSATSAPTNAPSAANIKVGLNTGSSSWWVGVIVSGGGETTVKVELKDSASTNWVTLKDDGYAFTYTAAVQLKAPLSIRVTSSTGKSATMTDIFSTFSSPMIDSGKAYSATSPATSAPTSAPTTKPTTKPTSAPATAAPTTKPTTPPSSGSGSTKITLGSGTTNWWLSLTVSGNSEAISKVELKDSASVSSFKALVDETWAYTFSTQGTALVAPLTIRVTTASGKTATATVSSFTPGASIALSSAL